MAERDFAITQGLQQNLKRPERSFPANQECIQCKPGKSPGHEAEVSGNAKGSSKAACLKLLIKEIKTVFQ